MVLDIRAPQLVRSNGLQESGGLRRQVHCDVEPTIESVEDHFQSAVVVVWRQNQSVMLRLER